MKKAVAIAVSVILICAFTVTGFSAAEAQSWYCVRNKDHRQPVLSADLNYVENIGGYYIDHRHGDGSEEKVVYLTFDAGYENGNVEKILDVLKQKQATGAFFILGNLVTKNTELVKRMADEGHLVCNHTFSHKKTTGKSKEEISSELCKLETLCKEKTGYDMAKYYRPPEGKFDQTSLMHIDSLGYKTVFWSFAYVDWENDKQPSLDSAKKKILENIHNGEIMLLHPTSETNALILGEIISELKTQGFRFGTLDELK